MGRPKKGHREKTSRVPEYVSISMLVNPGGWVHTTLARDSLPKIKAIAMDGGTELFLSEGKEHLGQKNPSSSPSPAPSTL